MAKAKGAVPAAVETAKRAASGGVSKVSGKQGDAGVPGGRVAQYMQQLVTEGDKPVGLSDLKTVGEYVHLFFGVCMLLVVGPVVGLVVGLAVLWEAVDRGFRGGFTQSGQELSGFLCSKVAPWVGRKTEKFNAQFVKRPEDAFMVNSAIAYGIFVPLMFVMAWWHHSIYGFSVAVFLVYHVIRIGPYFMNFAYVYTLCHKEGHSRRGLWKGNYNNLVLRNFFNWWIGLFYGVLPSSFAYGHSINHHRYNNGPNDIITTADKPRDNFLCFIAYLPRWLLYAANISTIIQFVKERNLKVTKSMLYGSVWYYGWLFAWFKYDAIFAVAFVLFPFFENIILLAGVNWSWHCFMDPIHPEDEYVQSITILDGPINVLNEDFHVVHHQYPGGHWTMHEKYLKKHWETYIERQGSVFKGTHAFEILAMVLLRDWTSLAERFEDLKGRKAGKEMTLEEKIALLKCRSRACWWGPRAPTDILRLDGRSIGNLDDGIGNKFLHESLDAAEKKKLN